MKVFLTGTGGFIGRNINENFSARYEVIAPTHKDLDLTDDRAVEDFFKTKSYFDVVIHCAVKPGHRNSKDPANQLYNNLRMFFNLIRNSEFFGKMIFISSGLVYDERFYMPKMKEDYFDKHIPVDEGGLSKYIAAKYIQKAERIVELRPFGVFGKYEDYAIRFISNAICKAIFDLPITIKQNRLFDYIYIDDFVKIVDYFVNNEAQYKSYNVTPDVSIELFGLAKMVKKISGKDIPIVIKKDGMGPEYSGNNGLLRSQIKQLSLAPLELSIEKLYKWYLENKDSINKQALLSDK